MYWMQKRLYFLNINLFIIHIVIKNFIINLNYLIKKALQQNRKLVSLFHRKRIASKSDSDELTIDSLKLTNRKSVSYDAIYR